MEKACIAYVPLSVEQVNLLRPYADMNYSDSLISKRYSVIVRERAATEQQFRRHIIQTLKRFNIIPKLSKHWLQTLPESEARKVIQKSSTEPDARLILLRKP